MEFTIFYGITVIFKMICVILTTSMIGFWTYKYQMNEDVSLIEYKSIDSMTEVMIPEFTICIAKPFVAKTLQEFGGNVTHVEYNKYLRGVERYQNDERFKNISFLSATIDVFDYLQYPIMIVRRNGNIENDTYACTNSRECHFVELRNSFSGFWDR